MIRKIILASVFMVTVLSPLFTLSIPHSRYLPIKTSFKFKLKSNLGNQMLFKSTIEIPEEAKEIGHVFVNWHMYWKNNNDLLKYRFRFRVSKYGTFYLVAISDGIYYRSIPEAIQFLSNYPKIGKEIVLGDNMSLTYTKTYSSKKIGGKKYSSVIQAKLKMADKVITLYFARGKGIVAIKSRDELFLTSS